MRDRHGSPFEHNSMTFYVQAPIFVFREFMRHRIASYNEESGRYRELRPVFYVPGPERKLTQIGKPGAYEFVDGNARADRAGAGGDPTGLHRGLRLLPAHAGRRRRAGGRPHRAAPDDLLVDVRDDERASPDELPVAAHQARQRRRPVLPAAGDRDVRRPDGGVLARADAAHPTPRSSSTDGWPPDTGVEAVASHRAKV